jgi:hypothetical protein
VRWEDRPAHIGEVRNAYTISLRKPEMEETTLNIGVHGRMILK